MERTTAFPLQLIYHRSLCSMGVNNDDFEPKQQPAVFDDLCV